MPKLTVRAYYSYRIEELRRFFKVKLGRSWMKRLAVATSHTDLQIRILFRVPYRQPGTPRKDEVIRTAGLSRIEACAVRLGFVSGIRVLKARTFKDVSDKRIQDDLADFPDASPPPEDYSI